MTMSKKGVKNQQEEEEQQAGNNNIRLNARKRQRVCLLGGAGEPEGARQKELCFELGGGGGGQSDENASERVAAEVVAASCEQGPFETCGPAKADEIGRRAEQQQQQQQQQLELEPNDLIANKMSATSLHQDLQQQQQSHPQPQPQPNVQQNICAACLKPIRERYLLMALDKQWHEDCLKCACCDCRLGEVGSSLFTHSDKILCRRDFLRIFGRQGSCAACKRTIPPYELVMRANENAYHLDCFSCQNCQYRFCVGDRFHLTNKHKVVCILCHSEVKQQQQQPTEQPTQSVPAEEPPSQSQLAPTPPPPPPIPTNRKTSSSQFGGAGDQMVLVEPTSTAAAEA